MKTTMQTIDLEHGCDFALGILKTAASMSRDFFVQSLENTIDIQYKEDDSPVTKADTSIETYLREKIKERYPQHDIIGEEFYNAKKPNDRYAWIIDPIDGTEAFTHNTPLFGNLLALFDFESMEPVLGLVSIPMLNIILHASKGNGTWNSQQRLDLSKAAPSHARPLFLSYDWGKVYKKNSRFVQSLYNSGIRTRTWADAFAYYLLASSKADLVIDPDTHIWDIAAIYPIITEAQGIVCDWNGNNLDWHTILEQNTADIVACKSLSDLETLDLF